MDRLTVEGVTTGRVALPGRAVHIGVWLRLLRTLLDEVSLAASRVSARSTATLARVWEATGRPPRGGLTTWRLYERLGLPLQQAMREAAATALRLTANGEITARGTLGRCVTPEPRRDVYEGDRQAWEEKQARAEIEAMIERARDDPGTAQHLLEMLTIGCRTVPAFYRERQYLVRRGIPWDMLPDHHGLGRADLRP
jgi:hypothetical protein